MHEHEVTELEKHLKSQFEGVEVIEDPFDVCAGEVCDHFGGCGKCPGMMVAREVDSQGGKAGHTRLFLCTHWCHRTKQA